LSSTEGSYAFFEGEFVPIEKANVSIRTHAFNYGTGCFEGIRAYWNEEVEQLLVFRLLDHYRRLTRSCRLLHISLHYTPERLCEITVELLKREGFQQDCYVRPVAYKSSKVVGLLINELDDDLCIFAVPFGRYIESEGACVGVSSWRRIEDSALPARGKLTGAYVNSALAKSEAILNGFDEAVVLTQDGYVSEGSSENLFMVRDGLLITPPVTDNVLEGITRDTVIQLAEQELGLPVLQRRINRTELYMANELFYSGTAAEVSPIVKVDHRPIGAEQIGPITSKLKALYLDVVRGRIEAYRHWCTPVGA
jgi:branched-chain amino acid aminotransferase